MSRLFKSYHEVDLEGHTYTIACKGANILKPADRCIYPQLKLFNHKRFIDIILFTKDERLETY